MGNGSRFPYRPLWRSSLRRDAGVTGPSDGGIRCKEVGGSGEANPAGQPRSDAEGVFGPRQGTVSGLPRKASQASHAGDRTGNRHRWARREASGARVILGQGTRQNVPVTSGEGEPVGGELRSGGSRSGPQRIGPSDCLAKTQVSAKSLRRRIGTDACPVPEG